MIYFAIMAAITLLLLWFFQFLFFNVLYYDRQTEHIKEISAELLSYEYGSRNPNNWNNFEIVAKSQNLNIYIFSFDVSKVEYDGTSYKFPSDADLAFYTPYFTNSHTTTDAINWTDKRKSEYLSYIVKMDDSKAFTYVEKNNIKGSTTDTIIYGGELKGYDGTVRKGYFCLIGTVSKSNYTVDIMNNMLLIATGVILIVSVIMAFIFSSRISSPIDVLAEKADQLAKGDFSFDFTVRSSTAEVQKLAASLNFAKDELSKTEQMRRDFIANVSHDLRTPLTMIKAYAEMVRDLSGNNPEKRTKHCQIIIDESNRLSLLVGDIQNLSKLQSGTDTFNLTKFDLNELCKTVVNRFGIMSETQGYILETELSGEALCFADYGKIEQVLYNLIGNALNYTGDDKKVTVRCVRRDGGFKVEIIDTGKGIDPSEIDAVWDRYYRANQKKRNIVGSGLGLNIVRMILEGHHAQYGVNSTLGEGTTFWFILPEATDSEFVNNLDNDAI